MSWLSKGIKSATDSVGLTDHKGAADARRRANNASDRQLALSEEQWDYWKEEMAPYQQGLMERQSQLYDEAGFTDEDFARALGDASGDVVTSFSRARDQRARELGRYGINPNSGKFVGLDDAMRRDQASAEVAARNTARAGLRDTEFARKSSALGLGVPMGNYAGNFPGLSQSGYSSVAGNMTSMANNLASNNAQVMSSFMQSVGQGAGAQMADGGEVESPRRGLMLPHREKPVARAIRGVADDIPVAASAGEYVVPRDSVVGLGLSIIQSDPDAAAHKLGVAMLDEFRERTHTPAETQRYGLRAMADGGEVEDGESWLPKVGKALGYGLLNGLTLGGLEQGRTAALRRQQEEENAAWQREQRDRQRKQMEKQDAYEADLVGVYQDAATDDYTGGDVNDPEFGLQAAYGQPAKGYGLRNTKDFDEKQYLAGVDRAMAKHMPAEYAARKAPKDLYGEMMDHPEAGLGQMGPDGRWHSIDPSKGGAGGGGKGGGDTTAYNALKSGLRDMFAKMDPAGNFFMPEGSDKEYGQALEIADELHRNGVPLGRATNMAYAAVRGPMKPEDARQKAEIEAAEKFGWTERGKRKAYTDQRAQELMEESRTALREYERIAGGHGGGEQQQAQQQQQAGPSPGTVVDGYRFRGGNPNDPNNWEPAK